MDKITDKNIFGRLKKHPFLKQYVNSYIKNDGMSEIAGYLPYLVIWFRRMFEKCGIEDDNIPDICGWDNDTAEEFWSWGHNSRWNNVFRTWLEGGVEDPVRIAFETMDEFGNPDFDCDTETEVKMEVKRQNENNK